MRAQNLIPPRNFVIFRLDSKKHGLETFIFHKKRAFSQNASNTLYTWSVFHAETITKQDIFRHMQFLLGNIDDFQVEKDHFQKSNIFALSTSEMFREIASGVQRNHIAPWVPSETHANTIGKRDVFGNGAVAGTFLRFRALKTVEIHCFLSSST